MTLQEYVENHIIPQYKAFDKAHNLDHVSLVIERSLALASQYGVDTDMAYAIAAYHDLGLYKGRERHHIVSGQIVAGDAMLQRWFTPEQIIVIKEAVEDHRASNNDAPRSIYGCIVAEADRLIDPDTTLRRTVQYGLKHLDTTNRELHYERFCHHLQEKYAEGGYMRLWLPESDNQKRLEELRAIIADSEELRCRFDQIFDEES
ncbi:MAG: HD domain-containing protein [Bacteroidaceae bacterium]|nr:HD domain-containing protein [Bacteroidaceae bacterium]